MIRLLPMMPFVRKKPSHFHILQEKWSNRHKQLQANLWNKHTDVMEWFVHKPKKALLTSLAGVMLLASPGGPIQHVTPVAAQENQFKDIDPQVFFLTDLRNAVPKEVRALTPDEEASIASLLSKRYNLHVTPEINGKRLNRTYGLIGAEQHLARYPGDTMETHFATADDATKYYSSGMAPGLGAWRYFGSDTQGVEREKYYIAVQTFLAPGYMDNVKEYNEFFKFRKMLVVNPENGKALIADIGDAGPSPWTGKHLGGSPEVMSYLERVDGAQKGPVLYFFIDDPTDSVPLGPIQ